jgi:hypothetical protein
MPVTALPAKPKQKLSYPRPPLSFQHGDLFREPAYQDGQPYADDDLEDDDEAA